MSVGPTGVMGRVESYLLRPVEPPPAAARVVEHPVVAVLGVAPGSGATTVARGRAVALAGDAATGLACVNGRPPRPGAGLPSRAADRMARALAGAGGGSAGSAGRLCIVDAADVPGLAQAARLELPLVLDAGRGPAARAAAALADRVVLVATPATEPALASLLGDSLGRIRQDFVVAVNRASDQDEWGGAPAAAVPQSRIGAALARSGRPAPGSFGRAMSALAAMCSERRTP